MPARTARSARASRSLWEPQIRTPEANPGARPLGNPAEKPRPSHRYHTIQREEDRRPLRRGPLLFAPLRGGGAECNQCEAPRIMVAAELVNSKRTHYGMTGRRLFSYGGRRELCSCCLV
jgi:hypothetical protein